MKFFIAGVMQGSKKEAELHSQNYRDHIKEALNRTFPDAVVYDPFERNKDSVNYAPKTGKKVFLTHNRMCGTEVDVLVAFVPEASMGTAVEIWEAWQNGAIVITVSPLAVNWVVKFLSDVVYPDLNSFYTALANGEIARIIQEGQPRSQRRSLENFEQLDAKQR